MSGIRGQKWGKEKRKPKRTPKTIGLTDKEIKKVQHIARECKWTEAHTIYNIFERGLTNWKS